MNLNWMFGSSMDAHHLLAAYITVWVLQFGYAGWIGVQWMRSNKPRG